MNQVLNSRTYLLTPTDTPDMKQRRLSDAALSLELQRIYAPRVICLNRFTKCVAIAGGIFGGIGTAGAVLVTALDFDSRDKLDLGATSLVFLLGGFLCFGISNCMYYHGHSSSSGDPIQLGSPV